MFISLGNEKLVLNVLVNFWTKPTCIFLNVKKHPNANAHHFHFKISCTNGQNCAQIKRDPEGQATVSFPNHACQSNICAKRMCSISGSGYSIRDMHVSVYSIFNFILIFFSNNIMFFWKHDFNIFATHLPYLSHCNSPLKN